MSSRYNWSEFREACMNCEKKHGLSWDVPYTIAHIETKSGEYPINEFNPLAIKGISLKGYSLLSKYQYAGQYEYSDELAFRIYDSFDDCLEDFVLLIKKVFPDAWELRRNPLQFMACILKGNDKWSCDQEYLSKFRFIHKRVIY